MDSIKMRLALLVEDVEHELNTQKDVYKGEMRDMNHTIIKLEEELQEQKSRNQEKDELIFKLNEKCKELKNSSSRSMQDYIKDLKKEIVLLRFVINSFENSNHIATRSKVHDENENENEDPNITLKSTNSTLNSSMGGSGILAQYLKQSNIENYSVKGLVQIINDKGNQANQTQLDQLDEIENVLSPKIHKQQIRKTYTAILNTLLAKAIKATPNSNTLKVVQLLLAHGANVEDCLTDEHMSKSTGSNILHHICENGNIDVLELLLIESDFASHIDVKNKLNKSALVLAAENYHHDIVKLLLRHGADYTEENENGETVLQALKKVEEDSNKAAREKTIKILADSNQLFWANSVRANRLYTEERYPEARQAYMTAINLTLTDISDNNLATLHYNCARTSVKLNNHSESIQLCTKAIELKQNQVYVNALAQRAASYMTLFDYSNAVADYRRLCKQHGASQQGAVDWYSYLNRAIEMEFKSKDYYEILGINNDASVSEIRVAFKKQVLKWHPDKNLNRGSLDHEERASKMIKLINQAYEVLSDDQKRTLYDIDRISNHMENIVNKQQQQRQRQSASVRSTINKYKNFNTPPGKAFHRERYSSGRSPFDYRATPGDSAGMPWYERAEHHSAHDYGGADEGDVSGVEEQYYVFEEEDDDDLSYVSY